MKILEAVSKGCGSIHRHYYIVFTVALTLRFFALALVLFHNDTSRLLGFTPDVEYYFAAVDDILRSFDYSGRAVTIFGPGFPSWLAIQVAIFGKSPIILTLINIIVGSVGSVLLTAFAFKITKERTVALVAGLLNAVSVLSISLSCILLSDVLFFTFILAGLLLFLNGLEGNKLNRFVTAGLIFGIASLIRSVGQFFYLVLILIIFLHYREQGWLFVRSLLTNWYRPVITILIMISIVAGWSIRNQVTHGYTQTALAGYGGLKALTILTRADLNGTDYSQELKKYHKELAEAEGNQASDLSKDDVFTRFVYDSFIQTLLEHPLETARSWSINVFDNINDDWGVHYHLIPKWEQNFRDITSWTYKKGLHYSANILALIGVILLWRDKRYREVFLLCGLFGYFAFLAGFSVWQGARIFYPGHIAQLILMAITIRTFFDSVKKRIKAAN